MPRFNGAVEVWVCADNASDAALIVGEHVGMNRPPEIEDYLVTTFEVDGLCDDE